MAFLRQGAESGCEWPDLEPSDVQHVVYHLRESIAQELMGLALHLCVLHERTGSGEMSSTISELRRVAAAALDQTIALAGFIELVVQRANGQRESRADVVGTELDALRQGNDRLRQLVADISRRWAERPVSQSHVAGESAEFTADGRSSA